MSVRLTLITNERAPEVDSPTWRDLAACLNFDNLLFFPEDGDVESMERAKEICATCPVIDYCLDYALETNQTEGIWGGTTRGERRSIRRRRLRRLREAG